MNPKQSACFFICLLINTRSNRVCNVNNCINFHARGLKRMSRPHVPPCMQHQMYACERLSVNPVSCMFRGVIGIFPVQKQWLLHLITIRNKLRWSCQILWQLWIESTFIATHILLVWLYASLTQFSFVFFRICIIE